jgi:hypothetical protein
MNLLLPGLGCGVGLDSHHDGVRQKRGSYTRYEPPTGRRQLLRIGRGAPLQSAKRVDEACLVGFHIGAGPDSSEAERVNYGDGALFHAPERTKDEQRCRRLRFRNMATTRYVRVLLTPDEAPTSPVLERTFLSRCAPQCRLDEYMVAAAPDIHIDPSMGQLWADLKPKNGRFTFEIATVLPFYLPNVEDSPDYLIKIRGRDYLVSLRVARVFFGPGRPADRGTSYLLAHLAALKSIAQQDAAKTGLHVVPFKTFVSHRFEVEATSAIEAVETNFEQWRDLLVQDVSLLVETIRASSPDAARHLLPQLATPAFPTIWLFVQGEAENRIGTEQFAGDLSGAALRSLTRLTREQADRATAVLAGAGDVSPGDSALALASSFCHYGFLGLALVQVAVACESELWRSYSEFVQGRGCSKTKLDEAESDITFSELLNVHVFSMCDMALLKDSAQVLGQVNWARKRRNEVVHGRTLSAGVAKANVEVAIKAARELVDFLRCRPSRKTATSTT